MKHRFFQLDISRSLQLSFLICAGFCLLVGVIGLYTWQQQRAEINAALTENFPKVQAAFQTEEQLSLLEHGFFALLHSSNTHEKNQWQNSTLKHLDTLSHSINQLDAALAQHLLPFLQQQKNALKALGQLREQQFTLQQDIEKWRLRLNWLHSDIHQEFIALLQELNWQQSSAITHADKFSRQRQQELFALYDLIGLEAQIVTELQTQMENLSTTPILPHQNYLSYLHRNISDKLIQLNQSSSREGLQQLLDEMIKLGSDEQALPKLQQRHFAYLQQQQTLQHLSQQIFAELRQGLKAQVGNSKKQLDILHAIIEKSSRINGLIILTSMLVAFLFVALINFGYIRQRLLKRFQRLNDAVTALSQGQNNVKIAVYGNDELGRIARLLRLYLFEMTLKSQELKKRNQILLDEINDRIRIQETLLKTQNELIQTAKLAVVGQTLTSISHEVTQPLNAMNAYLFSAQRALAKGDNDAVQNYLHKIVRLVERTALIVKRLRNFSRQGSANLRLLPLHQCINEAWELLSSKHQACHAQITIAPNLPYVWGEEILLEQVFVNVFLNALEAMENDNLAPQIDVEIYAQTEDKITLWISDNGKGFPLNDKLLQPFSSSKSLNLGLGLSISQSIMQQCGGRLLLASTLTRNALIILEFSTKEGENAVKSAT